MRSTWTLPVNNSSILAWSLWRSSKTRVWPKGTALSTIGLWSQLPHTPKRSSRPCFRQRASRRSTKIMASLVSSVERKSHSIKDIGSCITWETWKLRNALRISANWSPFSTTKHRLHCLSMRFASFLGKLESKDVKIMWENVSKMMIKRTLSGTRLSLQLPVNPRMKSIWKSFSLPITLSSWEKVLRWPSILLNIGMNDKISLVYCLINLH